MGCNRRRTRAGPRPLASSTAPEPATTRSRTRGLPRAHRTARSGTDTTVRRTRTCGCGRRRAGRGRPHAVDGMFARSGRLTARARVAATRVCATRCIICPAGPRGATRATARTRWQRRRVGCGGGGGRERPRSEEREGVVIAARRRKHNARYPPATASALQPLKNHGAPRRAPRVRFRGTRQYRAARPQAVRAGRRASSRRPPRRAQQQCARTKHQLAAHPTPAAHAWRSHSQQPPLHCHRYHNTHTHLPNSSCRDRLRAQARRGWGRRRT